MGIGLVAAVEPLEHLEPAEPLALAAAGAAVEAAIVAAIEVAMADVRAQSSSYSSFEVQHRLTQPIAVVHLAVNIQMPDQTAVVYKKT